MYAEVVPVDDEGRRRCVISDECSHEWEAQNEDLEIKMTEDFVISQEETGFPLLK